MSRRTQGMALLETLGSVPRSNAMSRPTGHPVLMQVSPPHCCLPLFCCCDPILSFKGRGAASPKPLQACRPFLLPPSLSRTSLTLSIICAYVYEELHASKFLSQLEFYISGGRGGIIFRPQPSLWCLTPSWYQIKCFQLIEQ